MARSSGAAARLETVRARAQSRRAPIPLPDAATLAAVGLDPLCEVVGAISIRDARGSFWTSGFIGADAAKPQTYTTSPPNQRVGVPATLTTLKTGFAKAFDRLLDEARALEAHGVLDLRVDEHRSHETYDVIMRGVAVRARRGPRPPTPFTTSMTGPQVASALRAGLVPVAYLRAPVMAIRYLDPQSVAQLRVWTANGEVEGFTDLVTACRAAARRDFAQRAAARGGDHAILDDVVSGIHGTSRDAGMHTATAVVSGTVLATFRAPSAPPRALTVLPLSDLTRRTS